MRRLSLLTLLAALVAVMVATAASAFTRPLDGMPGGWIPPGPQTSWPTPPPNPVPAPTPSGNLPVEDYCVQTAEAGETYVQANPGSFDPGGSWYSLWLSQAQVILDGKIVTLQYEDGKGEILAAHVPDGSAAGYFATCSQPYVSTNGVYADPSYGVR